MKSEHRHELKTNDLGKWAAEVGQSASKHINQIIAAVVGILLLVGIAFYWSHASAAAKSAGWNEVAAAQSAEGFANVADKYKGTIVGAWARLKEGELHLDSGMRLMFTDRASGISDLNKAKKSLEEVAYDPDSPADVKERALFALGRCLETLSDRNTDDAIAVYQRLVTDYAYTPYKNIANSRIEALRTGGAQEFYSWFHEQNPKPADRDLPRDLRLPGMDEGLLGPDLLKGVDGASGDGKEDASSDGATPTDEKSTPADKSETPDASEKPAEDAATPDKKPADDSKPE